MNKRREIMFIIWLVFSVMLFVDLSWARPIKPDKSKPGICDIAIERLKKRQDEYNLKRKQLNEKILKLQKQEAKLQRVPQNRKYSDLENQINALVVSLAEAEDKIALAEAQIREYQERKERLQTSVSEREQEIEQLIKEAVIVEVEPRLQKEQQLDRLKADIPVETEPAKAEYKIAAHDELQINVYGEPDLTKTVRVAVDGSISYPLLGRVPLAGLTAQQLEERIAKLLSDGGYLIGPQVSVYVERFSPISILGEVRNPGSYELKGKLGILDAIAQAGGFNIDADMNNVKIMRVEDGQQKTIQLRLGDVKKGIEGAEVTLKPNDTIFVEKIGKISVLGEVTRPGTFELKDRITVLEAIAMAGGFTDIAAINSTRIIRESTDDKNKKKIIRVKVTDVTCRGRKNKDIELAPGDIVYVPESLF